MTNFREREIERVRSNHPNTLHIDESLMREREGEREQAQARLIITGQSPLVEYTERRHCFSYY